MRLIKTVGGNNGAPIECGRCGEKHFVKSGIAWHCTACGIYHPTRLGFESLKEGLKNLQVLPRKLKFMLCELEDISKN